MTAFAVFTMVLVVAYVALVIPLRQRAAFLTIGLVATYAIANTFALIRFEPGDRGAIAGIAPSDVSVNPTELLVLMSIPLLLVVGRAVDILVWLVPGAVGLLVLTVFVWPDTPSVRSGSLMLGICLLAWALGGAFGRNLSQPDQERILAISFLLIFAFELALCIYQLFAGVAYGRATGTFGHPAMLGKLVLVTFIVLLPLTSSPDPVTARLASLAVGCSLVATMATLSRANAIAVLGAVLLWVILGNRGYSTRQKTRLVIPLSVGFLMSLPFIEAIASRFDQDSQGGDRPELLDAGLRAVQENWLLGVGPNHFVESRSSSEPIVAITGYPVHNAFLLAVAEIGIVGVILVALPLGVTLWRSLRRKQTGEAESRFAKAFLISIAFIGFASLTSWGFLASPTLTLIFFLSGVVFSFTRAGLAADKRDHRSGGKPRQYGGKSYLGFGAQS